jgi:glycerol kinase
MPAASLRAVGMSILAIDAGTTGITALVVDATARVVGRGYREFPQYFPESGWVEHDPEEIWQATLAACRDALDSATDAPPVRCIGITNQRETAVLWDRRTLRAPRRALVWQDRRTAAICERLIEAGHEPRVAELTGLRLDPYFTGTKLTWLAEHDPAWAGVRSGEVAVGTVDAYLIARLTAGQVHATDASNASRTLLYDISTGGWSEELCTLLDVPRAALPAVRPSWGEFGRTDPDAFLGLDLPVTGVAGDQQAALFGQACYSPGDSKCTYGTGSFILINTGAELVRSSAGLLTTVAWQAPDGALSYALEGAIFVTGAAVQWLRDGLGLIELAAHTEDMANSVPDSGGVVFVPALTGLGAPHWDPDARGALFGLTRGTTPAHLARATLEAIAFQVRDVVEVMTADAGLSVPVLTVDGGASANGFLCQVQADQLQIPVERPEVLETTGLGAAFLAGLGAGIWQDAKSLADTWRLDRRFEPGPRDDAAYRRWQVAVERSRGWAAL